MRFGIRPQEDQQDFTNTLSQAVAAEEHGFDAVYLAEHSGFTVAPYWPSPLVELAGIATRTRDIDVGTNVLLLPLYNPVRLAGDIACLDVMSEGRARLGMGIGWREAEYDAHGVPFEERGPRASEALRLVTTLLEGGPTTFDGEFYGVEDFELVPKPVQSPRPPVFVGGWSTPAMKRAVRLADGWVSPGGGIERNAAFADEFRERGGGTVVVGTEGVVVREDRSAAMRDAKEFLKYRKVPHIEQENELRIAEFQEYLDRRGEEIQTETEEQVLEYAERMVEYELEDGLDAYVEENMFIAGTPDDCIEQIDDIVARTGCDELILRLHVAGVETAATEETLSLLGEEVVPSFA